MNFSLEIDAGIELSETPIWDWRVKRWFWTDLFSGDVHEYDPVTKAERMWQTKPWIGSAVPTSDLNQLMCVLEDGVYLLNLQTGALEFVVDPEPGNSLNRYNDSRCDSRGRIFISSVAKTYGTDAYTSDQRGSFYMVDTDKSVIKIVDGINQYNDMTWNLTQTKMYVVDTFNETLLEFDYDLERGPVGEPRVVLDFKGREGMPDGLSIDEEGNLYICHWTQKISVWSPDFKRVNTLSFPVEYVCCGGFGGDDMRDFYVTSSRFFYSDQQLAENPGAGGVFAAKSPIPGRREYFYPVHGFGKTF